MINKFIRPHNHEQCVNSLRTTWILSPIILPWNSKSITKYDQVVNRNNHIMPIFMVCLGNPHKDTSGSMYSLLTNYIKMFSAKSSNIIWPTESKFSRNKLSRYDVVAKTWNRHRETPLKDALIYIVAAHPQCRFSICIVRVWHLCEWLFSSAIDFV